MLVRGLVVSGGGWHFFNCFLPESEKGGGDERRREGSRWWPTVERRRGNMKHREGAADPL